MFGGLVAWCTALHFRGLVPLNGILPGEKFTLRPILALLHVTRAVAGRPSRWASVHILLVTKIRGLAPL